MQSALEQDPGDMGRRGVVGEEPLSVFGLARVEREPKGRDQDGIEQAIEVPDKLEHQVSNHDCHFFCLILFQRDFYGTFVRT